MPRDWSIGRVANIMLWINPIHFCIPSVSEDSIDDKRDDVDDEDDDYYDNDHDNDYNDDHDDEG